MNTTWILRTARLILTPVTGADLPDLQAIKSDPRVFAIMLGGVRSPARSAEELSADMVAWGANGYGVWTIRDAVTRAFVGITGLQDRPDGRGVALRFALWPEAQGRGLAREAASAALRFGHERAGLTRIVAVAREANFASRMVLGGIGMTERETFIRDDHVMVLFDSVRAVRPEATPGRAL